MNVSEMTCLSNSRWLNRKERKIIKSKGLLCSLKRMSKHPHTGTGTLTNIEGLRIKNLTKI